MRGKLRKRIGALSRWLDGAGADRPKPVLEPLWLEQVYVEADPTPDTLSPRVPSRLMLARVFDSAHPVRSPDELLGRERELDDLLAATLDFGQHAIVHGARGSGKTSLVRVFGDRADQNGAIVIYMACEPDASFGDLVMPYLRALPNAAKRAGGRDGFDRDLERLATVPTPRAVVEFVAEHVATPVIFIFDEFDRITDPKVKSDIAAAMKLLSDALSSVLFMLVGIARDVSDVVEAHPSLRRHMRIVSLGRIEAGSVDALIDLGAAAAGMRFDAEARAIIARAACGSPFHVRIFAHNAALAAVQHGSTDVHADHVRYGLKRALEHWASMNGPDAATFVRLVEGRHRLGDLERAARHAAVHDRLEDDGMADADGMNLLADAIRAEVGNEAAMVFRDSVAPQFLIVLIILAEAASAATTSVLLRKASDAVAQ